MHVSVGDRRKNKSQKTEQGACLARLRKSNIAVAEYVRRKIQETRSRRDMGRVARSGKVLSGVLKALAFTLNELERRILSKKVTGFYLYFCRITLISRLRIEWAERAQKRTLRETTTRLM